MWRATRRLLRGNISEEDGGECEKATDTTGDTIGSGVLRAGSIRAVDAGI